MMYFLRWSPGGMTGPQKAYWESFSMMMTPLDYWKSGMDLWLRTAEAQMDMTFRMVSLMPSWEVGLMTARGLSDDRVTLRPSKDGKPVLRSVAGTTPQTSIRPPALKPVDGAAEPVVLRGEWPAEPVVEAMVGAAAEIRDAVAEAAGAQIEAAAGIQSALSDVVEAQIEAAAGMAAPLLGASGDGDGDAAPSPAEAVAEAVADVQAAIAEAASAQLEAAVKIADAVDEVVGVQADTVTIAAAQVLDIAGATAEGMVAAMAETAAPYLAEPDGIEPFAAPPVDAMPVDALPVDALPVDALPVEPDAAEPVAEAATSPAANPVQPESAAAEAPSRKRRQPSKPRLPAVGNGGTGEPV